MKLILASSNKHKADELKDFFKETQIEIESAPEKLEVIEDGKSFEENAFKKAQAYYEKFKRPVLSDDSGLVLECRDDILGIYSARFAPEFSDYKDKCSELIKTLGDEQNRNAYFICVLCVYISPEEVYFFEGRLVGKIGTELKGSNGFGYDPVFFPNKLGGESIAENPEWKALNSHRAKALQQLIKFFD